MKFTIPVPPCPASRPRVTRWATYYSPKYEAFRTQCKAELKAKLKEMAGVIIAEYIFATQTFFIPVPKAYSKKMKESLIGTFCNDKSKGDLDNHEKALWDCLNDLVIKDDSFIVASFSKKVWCVEGEGRIEFDLREIGSDWVCRLICEEPLSY